MSAARIEHIVSNLDFAHESNRELSGLISEAQKANGAVKHISQKAAAILSAVRECFDYCIADIKDDFLAQEARKVYFPFHTDTLGKGKPLFGLLQTAKPTYDKLLSVTAAIHSGDLINGTMCLYSDVRAVNDLVNTKKHDRVIEVCESDQSKSRIEFPNGACITVSPMIPMGANGLPDHSRRGPVGPEAWQQTPGVSITAVKDFFFDASEIPMSRTDVHGFCMTAITATRFILGEVYNTAYGKPLNLFHEKHSDFANAPASALHNNVEVLNLTKEEAVSWTAKVGLGASRFLYYRHWPVIVGLFLDDMEQMKIEYDIDGNIKSNAAGLIPFAQHFLLDWQIRVSRLAGNMLAEEAAKSFHRFLSRTEKPRYFEITELHNDTMTLSLGWGTNVCFNRIVWGIGAHYSTEIIN